MKSIFPLLIILFISETLFGQTSVQFSHDSDTAYWYRFKNDNVKQFKLGLIEYDTTNYTFRFWSFGLVIKVVGTTSQNCGEIIRFVEEYPKKKKKNVYTKNYPITSSQVLQIRHLIDSLQIESLPSDKNIKGWQQGLDGVEYFTEFKKGGQYTFKNYWTPTAQDSLKEAIQLQGLVSGLSSILDLKNNGKAFQDDIPFDGWTYPGSASAVLRVNPKKKNGG